MKNLFYLLFALFILSSCDKPDEIDPTISTCATDKAISADVNLESLVPDLTSEIIASDDMDGSLTITQSPVAGSVIGIGTTIVTITATDDEGNFAICTVNVVVTDDNPPVALSDSITMGAGYADDIYYSLKNGVVKNSARSSWDIAFSADPMTSSIIINEGYGIELYAYPNGDKDAWDNIDISGMDAWTPMFNSDTTWLNGAFDRNSTGHPDYGWGVYNSMSHDVMGDSIFIIKLADGSLKKIFIEKRAAMTNSFTIKYGDIDAAGETKVISCSPYVSKNFIYFSLTSGEVIDNEPASADWDLVFTKYYDESIPYIVTGVLSNINTEIAEVRGEETDLADIANAVFTNDISTIGSDWKSFNMGTFKYDVEEDLCYFVKTQTGDIYKMVFTGTDGSATGKMVFKVEKAD